MLKGNKFYINALNRTTLTDALSGLRKLPDKCVHCIVTSPPYWNLRDYGVPGQLGLEDTPQQFVKNMVRIFREARRVLRDDGTLWINIGDSYAAKGKNRTPEQAKNNTHLSGGYATQMQSLKQKTKVVGDLKPKDMVGIPWMLAFALRADGWYLRQDIIWYKPNPMPESIQDRCTKAHEYIFLFAKSERYYYDAKAIATEVTDITVKRLSQDIENQKGSDRAYGGKRHNGPMKASGKLPSNWDTTVGSGDHGSFHKNGRNKGYDHRGRHDKTLHAKLIGEGLANRRSVWIIPDPMDIWRWMETYLEPDSFKYIWEAYAKDTLGFDDTWKISTQAFKDAHFATFPEELPSRCIRAGTSGGGVCSACGAPYIRQTEKTLVPGNKAAKTFVIDDRDADADKNDQASNRIKDGHKSGWHYNVTTLGWKPSCECNAPAGRAVVLDMFAGAGTTQLTAENLGRDSIGFELNPEYKAINDKRRLTTNPLFYGMA